jgi:hypothetical protein
MPQRVGAWREAVQDWLGIDDQQWYLILFPNRIKLYRGRTPFSSNGYMCLTSLRAMQRSG